MNIGIIGGGGVGDLGSNKNPGYFGRNGNPHNARVDAHIHRPEKTDQTNKNPNGGVTTKVEGIRADLEELFTHHYNRKASKNFGDDESTTIVNLLDSGFFDSLETYQGFGIYTKSSEKDNRQTYDLLCSQYRNLMIENNQNIKNGSLIIRSIDEIRNSDDIVMIVYQDRLIAAIRLQEQSRRGGYLYQRGGLLVCPDFRGSIAGVRLGDFLIKTINERNCDKPIYGVTKSQSVIKSNQDSGSESHKVDILKDMFPQFYDEVVEARGGEDFSDMNTGEMIGDYSVTLNKILKDLLLDENITLVPHAQLV